METCCRLRAYPEDKKSAPGLQCMAHLDVMKHDIVFSLDVMKPTRKTKISSGTPVMPTWT